ncbi:NAD-dependent dehydratase [Bifidobacterium dolichotidis]|uniref:NAD-dependent dehydratase n=1 Tax=Bifidobacterium dolichotidis TaxID=2306976 RepID=A0A430FS65_9BIFI|nr:NAD(P)H-binding protein [Bifidobacterium dolichotidis]RSX55711.1 NAD-dependent dehydratase [Bifidobacterium dolichotidis]
MARTVAILGAAGRIAKLAEPILLAQGLDLVLYARHPQRINSDVRKSSHVHVVQGEAMETGKLAEAVEDASVVYANFTGGTGHDRPSIVDQAESVVDAMKSPKHKRLVWVSSLGIYDEIPGMYGQWNRATLGHILVEYAEAAKVIEDSHLDYTIIRPAWVSDTDEVTYEITDSKAPTQATEVPQLSVANIVSEIMNGTFELQS